MWGKFYTHDRDCRFRNRFANVSKKISVFSIFTYYSKLEDLVMEKDGRPVRSIILTSWRSGSTFLGDVVNAHPANFYHYEPLLDYGIVQIREPPLADESLMRIISLLNCEYKELGNFISFIQLYSLIISHV